METHLGNAGIYLVVVNGELGFWPARSICFGNPKICIVLQSDQYRDCLTSTMEQFTIYWTSVAVPSLRECKEVSECCS